MACLEAAVLEQEDLGAMLIKLTGYLQAACQAPQIPTSLHGPHFLRHAARRLRCAGRTWWRCS